MPSGLGIRKIEGKPGQVYYPLETINLPESKPKENEVVVKISAAALNHRDLFLRQHLYPGIAFGVPLLADGSGVVVATGSNAAQWKGKRVILNPGTGWKDNLAGPENPIGHATMGGNKHNPLGTLCEEIVIDAGELEEAPTHLSAIEGAALPLTGLTAWRATITKSDNAKPGHNILVTGIGGGVALMALLFAHAAGANVFVSSSSEEKLQKAKALGAAGCVNYKEANWEDKLLAQLPEDRKYLDAIIDGAGGDIVSVGAKLLKQGGVISCYGMTIAPKMPFLMKVVIKNIDLRSTTMGSRKEFADMVQFVREKKLTPIVSRVVTGFTNGSWDIAALDDLWQDMKKGTQFGKLVIEIAKESELAKL